MVYIMPNIEKWIDPLLDEFSSEEEAGEFWDTHSITDYEEYYGLHRRTFE